MLWCLVFNCPWLCFIIAQSAKCKYLKSRMYKLSYQLWLWKLSCKEGINRSQTKAKSNVVACVHLFFLNKLLKMIIHLICTCKLTISFAVPNTVIKSPRQYLYFCAVFQKSSFDLMWPVHVSMKLRVLKGFCIYRNG